MSESSLPGGGGAGERRPGFRAAGASLQGVVAPIVARHGGGVAARLKAHWAAIVGPELAPATWPESLARDGGLKLRVAPAKALEVQHRTPLLIDRINLFFGRPAVTRITLVQGPLPLPAPPRAAPERAVPAAASAALDGQLSGIRGAELRAALARLGQRVLAARR